MQSRYLVHHCSYMQIHHTLEARLAAAEEVRKAAELEKLEKEESAKNALAEQEAIMKKVVQESKLLQQEAEENAKVATLNSIDPSKQNIDFIGGG